MIVAVGCSRCYRSAELGQHPGLVWRTFRHSVEDSDGTEWTEWATCPTTGDPILSRSVPRVSADAKKGITQV